MKIVVLWEEGFPFVDTVIWPQKAIRAALQPPPPPKDKSQARSFLREKRDVRFVGIKTLAAELTNSMETVLITPYGSAFPKAAWPAIYDYLNRGGSWVNVGGSPLSRPVRKNRDGSWHVEVSTTAYSKELFINQAFPIELSGDEELTFDSISFAANFPGDLMLACSRAWSLQVRFTDTKDFPREGGSSGTRDARIETLLCLKQGEKYIAAPVVQIDRLNGPFTGGTWLLVNAELTVPLDATLLRYLVALAITGPIELDVRPSFACYYQYDSPDFSVRIKAPRLRGTYRLDSTLGLGNEEDSVEYEDLIILHESAPSYKTFHFGQGRLKGKEPGLYSFSVYLIAFDGTKWLKEASTGFWIYDEKLLTSGKPLTLNRDYFERDGEPYPVMGTTYMAGDTHRKFLFEPNPAIWDQDFTNMKAAGVNMVRTGFWTAWKRAMLDPGAVDEGVLRAFTAFLLTARKHDIPVIFNFFAFWPEEWGGSNPYLDPRAVEAQKELVAAFAHRFAHVNDLIWDFINEPSFSSPARVWSTRPNYDKFERAAWAKWLDERAASFSQEEAQAADPADVWRERWRLTPNAPLDLPALADFQDQYIFQGTHPLRVLDYKLFTQEMFNRWVTQLAAVVRSNGNPHQLITVGQDEGGTGDRPNPHFFADVVDFTTNHSWWQNDDLLWDTVMTKTPNKPTLIQETGIMFVENVDGGYRRTPEDCANLLARKLALSFAAGGAGAIQWLWNTNVYMDSDNEVGIGFLRADGTEKPELEVFRSLAKFFWKNRHRMVDRKLEETAIVIPHSNMFSVRNHADAAMRRAIRILEYDLGVPTRTVSEYRIQDIGDPQFIVLPSPRVLTQACWETLLTKVQAGATLLVTGPIDWDEYWRPVARLAPFGLTTATRPVAQTEEFRKERNETFGLHYRGDSIHKVDKAVIADEETISFRVLAHGTGQIVYCPLPFELARQPLTVLYSRIKSFRTFTGMSGLLNRRVEFAASTLHLLINESGSKRHDVVQHFTPFDLALPEERIALVFVDKESKEVVDKFEQD